jgi:hypothetical protein
MKRLPYRSGLEISNSHEKWEIVWNPRHQLGILIPSYVASLTIFGFSIKHNNISQYKEFVMFAISTTILAFTIWIAFICFQKKIQILYCDENKVIWGSGSISRQELKALVVEKEIYSGSTRNNYYILLSSGEKVGLASIESLEFGADPFLVLSKGAQIDVVNEVVKTANYC